MARYQPELPFSTPMILLVPEKEVVKGAVKKTYPKISDVDRKKYIFNCSFKTYGGTETTINDLYTVQDTANIETWYRPDITSDCRICFPDGSGFYEIIGVPENIERRNQFLKFKVQGIRGGA